MTNTRTNHKADKPKRGLARIWAGPEVAGAPVDVAEPAAPVSPVAPDRAAQPRDERKPKKQPRGLAAVFAGPQAASDVDSAAAQQVNGRPIEAPPSERPGGQLRLSMRAASRGWYAPRLRGAPSTTRQTEILNTALIGPPTSSRGIVNGRDNLSRTMVSHDAFTAYNSSPRLITSPNVLFLGTVGSGKSSGVKTTQVARPLILTNRRACIWDKKPQGAEGEYAAVTRKYGTEPLSFSAANSSTRLNLLDPLIVEGTGLQGQTLLLNAVARIARNDVASTEWEKKAIRDALGLAFASFEDGRTPTAGDLLPFLGRVPNSSDLSNAAKDRLHQAGLSIRYALDELLAEYGGMLDGETSKNVDLTHRLTTFDISQLPDDGPAIPSVMAIGNMWLMGRLRREAASGIRFATNVVYEEGWHMIGGPSAALVKSNQKLSRSLGISNVFVMHKGTDIPEDSPGYTVVQEAQTVYIYRQDRPADADWCVRTFNLEPETAETLMNLRPGHCIMKIGSNPEVHLEHIRSPWEAELTETDEGMAGAATV